jgi:hypothetical protein
MSDRSNVLFIERVRQFEALDPEEFDRIEFAMQALRRLRPRGLTVAVYRRNAELRVDCVRDLRRGEGARWAMVGIPPRASREQIAHALADLAGVADVPYTLDVLLRASRATA